MLHFIPAWYQENTWHENEQKWYVRRMHTEFDDTVKQVQLFHRNKVYPYQLLLLSFSPNLRHFLHRQGVYRAPYWSCFDAIQEVKRKKAVPLSFHNIKWPEHVEFAYTPFAVSVLYQGERYAQVEFGEDGNPIEIHMYKKEKIFRRNIYDDRGFLSSSVVYQDGQPYYQDYLTEKGTRKLRCYQDDGHVEVNPACPCYDITYGGREETKTFLQSRYDNMGQVIREVLRSYLELAEEGDLFCVALDGRHGDLLKDVLAGKKVILSFFGNRFDYRNYPHTAQMVDMAKYIVADSREQSEQLKRYVGENSQKLMTILPYDTRVDFGISQQLEIQKILVPVDDMKEENLRGLIQCLGKYLLENDKARIHLFTRRAEYDRKTRILEQVQTYLQSAGLTAAWGKGTPEQGIAENKQDPVERVKARFVVEQCVDELSVSRCMREQRIMVDMRELPALYLQILAVSTGIPQIVRRGTQFVEPERNGKILQDMDQLTEALRYYLGSLQNWNDAVVHSYEIGKKYSSSVLINKWKEVIDFVG